MPKEFAPRACWSFVTLRNLWALNSLASGPQILSSLFTAYTLMNRSESFGMNRSSGIERTNWESQRPSSKVARTDYRFQL